MRLALHDAAAEAVPHLERLVGAAGRVDPFRAPPAQARIELASARQIAGVKLQMNHRIALPLLHALPLRLGSEGKIIAAGPMSLKRFGCLVSKRDGLAGDKLG